MVRSNAGARSSELEGDVFARWIVGQCADESDHARPEPVQPIAQQIGF